VVAFLTGEHTDAAIILGIFALSVGLGPKGPFGPADQPIRQG